MVFWTLVSFDSTYVLISIRISPLIYELFRSIFLNHQIYIALLVTFSLSEFQFHQSVYSV